MWRRVGVVVLTVLAVTHADAALAANVSPNPKKIAANSVAVSSCGSLSGLGVSWTSTANVVTTVVLSSIPAACTGETLSLTLVSATNAALASIGPTAITGTTQTFTSLSGSATATSVTGAHVAVTGP